MAIDFLRAPSFSNGSGYLAPPQTRFNPYFQAPTPPPSPVQILGLLQQLVGALSQLSQQWAGFLGPQQPSQNPGAQLPFPSDPQEFSSYLQAQNIGGTLQGKTGIAQQDAIPGSRFGRVQDSTMWQASVARNYAYQFAAYAHGDNPLTPQGVAAGAQAMQTMSPDAQLFMQVASVFKGNLFNGPGFYDNPGLKNLLLSRGLTDLANKPQVGETDVQSIGAVAAAINQGSLKLTDVLASGTIDNLPRYNQIIGYVQQGGFAQDLRHYDSVPI